MSRWKILKDWDTDSWWLCEKVVDELGNPICCTYDPGVAQKIVDEHNRGLLLPI